MINRGEQDILLPGAGLTAIALIAYEAELLVIPDRGYAGFGNRSARKLDAKNLAALNRFEEIYIEGGPFKPFFGLNGPHLEDRSETVPRRRLKSPTCCIHE